MVGVGTLALTVRGLSWSRRCNRLYNVHGVGTWYMVHGTMLVHGGVHSCCGRGFTFVACEWVNVGTPRVQNRDQVGDKWKWGRIHRISLSVYRDSVQCSTVFLLPNRSNRSDGSDRID